eukprot:2308624-Pyramimonas_sp.AAC.1
MITGNSVADEVAGWAATEARLPIAIRHRVLMHERRARLVRVRVLRSAQDAVNAEGLVPWEKPSSSPVVVPPSAASRSPFSPSHCLDDAGQGCTRGGGPVSRATAVAWRIA